MKKLILLILLLVPFALLAEEKIVPVILDGDQVSYDYEKGLMVAKGNVHLKHKEVEIFCDEATYDAKGHRAQIKGNVRMIREGATITGDEISYDFQTQDADIGGFKYVDPPVYAKAAGAEKRGKEQYILREGQVTTCDLEEPHYQLIARRITVYPGQRIVAHNIMLKVGNIPVFFFPYFSHVLKDRSFPGEVIPGKNSEWGIYLLTRWRYYLNEGNRGKVLLDYYEDRGFGQGITHNIKSKSFGNTLVNLYHIEDELYSLDKRNELFDDYPERASIPPKHLKDERYRMQFAHDWQPMPRLSIKSEYNKMSDEFFTKDFFNREYQIEPQPKTYNLIDYAFNNSALSLFTRKRVNQFFTVTEYLPQLEHNLYRQKLFDGPLYLQSKTIAGSLSIENANHGVLNPGADADAARFHSHNVISLPKRLGWLHVTPHAGTFNTFYSRDMFGNDDIDRFAPEFGLDLHTKAYKHFDTDFNVFGERIDQMRHVITPTVSYNYIKDPTVDKNSLFQFDEIDGLDREEKVVFKLDNKIQAENAKRTWDLLYFSPSVEYAIHEEGKGSHFKSLYTEFELYPRKGISLMSDVEYDLEDNALKEANIDINFSDAENGKYGVSLGHRYLRGDSSQGTLNFRYQLTPKLEFSNYIRYEYKTDEFQEQQYRLRTDLHCWWMDLGLDINEDKDFTIWVIFRLKAFPDVHVGFDQTYSGAKDSY